MPSQVCPLCAESSDEFASDSRRTYRRCLQCDLVFADPISHLDRAAEKAVYDQHENYPQDPRYRRFLSQLFQPLVSRLSPGMHGLDFGCGPGPTLSVMLEEVGMHMELYDPFFAPDTSVLQQEYDFVTCTEVAEHFYHPAKDWTRIACVLRAGSWLGIMTRLRDASQCFDQWYYKNDPTHVSFYSPTTMEWLAWKHGLAIEHQDHNVILFRKA